ncbi:MAG: molybdopterin-synthase adenylyltransferase MoeB [Rhodospirillaceae bacterium]|nr:MAG: molybdopterin-synthase adenylyltransferase MoeB [Rhodospirillaceae bacterium]
MEFRDDQIHRYARHILLQEVGGVGQEKLLNAKVLVVGAGGLGSPVILYLAAAGVGTIGVVDDDKVDLSNLQRQILHTTASVGKAKVASAKDTVAGINGDVNLVTHRARLNAANIMDLIAAYDIIVDGSDNFATRFLVNDACYLAKRTLVSAAVLRFDGQLATFKAHDSGPCYRCIYPEAPPDGTVPSCSEAGILGAVAGVMGTLQATEVLKEILGLGQGMSGRLLIYDALTTAFRTVKVNPDPECALCGPRAAIKDLSGHK